MLRALNDLGAKAFDIYFGISEHEGLHQKIMGV